MLCTETKQFCTWPLIAVVTKALQGMAEAVGWEGLYRLCIAQWHVEPYCAASTSEFTGHLEDGTSVLKVTAQDHGASQAGRRAQNCSHTWSVLTGSLRGGALKAHGLGGQE